jgi:hypothetical protein
MPVPPVDTRYWDSAAWIAFIDSRGKWKKPDLEKRYKQAIKAYQDGIYTPVECAQKFDVSPVVMSHGMTFFNVEVRG